jgi:D-beta-D-heptose 7-phosphate kinase/D-beta-D-heptose 1-phosphate adenosyltransferase
MPTTLANIESRIFKDDLSLSRQVHRWRFLSKTIVFTNGCFDLLHPGHLHLLSQAADLGDILVVGLNSDASVSRLKGPNRPIIPQNQRALHLASLFYVDGVVIFDEETPLHLIEAIKPDVLVKGADYEEQDIVGAEIVKSYGGQIFRIPLLSGYSTSVLSQIKF